VIVVDASVLLDLLLGRPATLNGVDEALSGREQEPLRAPELIEPEVLHALRRLVRTSVVESGRAAAAVAGIGQVRLVRYSHAPLRERVWQLRDDLSAYDATYLALAEALDGAVLLTGDGGLAQVAGRMIGSERVRHLA